jgi:hypothetical protein
MIKTLLERVRSLFWRTIPFLTWNDTIKRIKPEAIDFSVIQF